MTTVRRYMTNPDVLHIGQTWIRNRDKTECVIRQVWRKRHQAMIQLEGRNQMISFTDLAKTWKLKED